MKQTTRHFRPWKLATVIIVAAMVFIFSGATPARAEPPSKPIVYMPEIIIPGVFDKPTTVDESLAGKYIVGIYVYLVWTIGAVGVAMVVFGGVRWIVAAGNPGQISDAKDTIQNAIIGIIIALSSYTLLGIISPKFLTIGLPPLPTTIPSYFVGAIVPDICQQNLKIDCGNMYQTGTIWVDKNTKKKAQPNADNAIQVDKYCMGTVCKHNALGTITLEAGFNRDQICVISKNQIAPDYGYYESSTGCVDQFPLSKESERVTPKQTKALVAQFNSCGGVVENVAYDPMRPDIRTNGGLTLIGGNCLGWLRFLDNYSNNGGCYTLSPEATIKTNPANNKQYLDTSDCPPH